MISFPAVRTIVDVSAVATDRANDLWSVGAPWDEILRTLRGGGFSKNDAIRASVEVLGVQLADAKRLVHGSEAWLDVKGRDERLHEEIVRELRP